MSIFPGLCGDIAATNYRVFLGTLPNLGIEERFLRQVQPVFPWYTSRKRVKEQANEFLEIDLAACDPELLLRYTHVFYSRRQLCAELTDRQLTLIETGKAAKLGDAALLNCLAQCNTSITPRLNYELYLLQQTKKSCRVPGRRELSPDAALEPHDYLCMMRVVEEDISEVREAETLARAYLPRERIEEHVNKLAAMLFDGASPATLDRKDQRLLQRILPPDYQKVGSVEKMRPIDVSALYRFYGERLNKLPPGKYFTKAMWGHIFRRIASHPDYLHRISLYWARYSGLDPQSPLSAMPVELATAACAQQHLFPALKFRAQYLYTSPDVARQQWRSDHVIPLLRLFPLLGAPAAEDLAAGLLIEGEWAKLNLTPTDSPLQEEILRRLRETVEQASAAYESNVDVVLKQVQEGAEMLCPPLTEAESLAMAGGTPPASAAPSE